MERIKNSKEIGKCLQVIEKEVSLKKLEKEGISILDYVICKNGNIQKNDERLKRILAVLDEKFVLNNMTVLLNCNRIKALFNEN